MFYFGEWDADGNFLSHVFGTGKCFTGITARKAPQYAHLFYLSHERLSKINNDLQAHFTGECEYITSSYL